MVAIQIRDVSEETRRVLAAEAESRGESLQGFLSQVLEREASDAKNREVLRSLRVARESRPVRTGASIDVPHIIREGRYERDQQILTAVVGADEAKRIVQIEREIDDRR